MLVRTLPVKNRGQLVSDVSDTFAIHASVVHDVTVTDSLVESGSTHGRVSATFTR